MIHTLLTICQGLIVPLYLLFAYQIFTIARQHKHVHKDRAKALGAVMAVFVLCSLAGYLSHLLQLPALFQLVVHVFLVAATIALVTSAAAKVLAAALKNDI